jgi:hypothetical protein
MIPNFQSRIVTLREAINLLHEQVLTTSLDCATARALDQQKYCTR